MISSFAGLRFVATPALLIGPFEDWSQVRSPGRARRRRRKYPQKIRVYYKPDPVMRRTGNTVYAHPETLAAVERALEERYPTWRPPN